MSMRNRSLGRYIHLATLALLLLFSINQTLAADSSDALGLHLKQRLGSTPDMHVDTIISPDAAALPEGSGSAIEGKILYLQECAVCHGIDGKQPGNAIVGGKGSINTDKPFKTVGSYWPHATTLYDYIARAMPYDKQKSLSTNEVYSITAYVLTLNHIIKKSDVMNKQTLPNVVMPNADGFNELQ